MAHLLKISLTKELFGAEKYRAVNWVAQITTSSAHVTIIRVIFLIKKNYNNLKFHLSNVISFFFMSSATKQWNQILGSYFENVPSLQSKLITKHTHTHTHTQNFTEWNISIRPKA